MMPYAKNCKNHRYTSIANFGLIILATILCSEWSVWFHKIYTSPFASLLESVCLTQDLLTAALSRELHLVRAIYQNFRYDELCTTRQEILCENIICNTWRCSMRWPHHPGPQFVTSFVTSIRPESWKERGFGVQGARLVKMGRRKAADPISLVHL